MTTTKRDPALTWNPLPEHASQPEIVPHQWIVHTFVDSPTVDLGEMQDYFEHSSNLESHTILGWAGHQQIMDFDRRADANYKANRFYVTGIGYVGAISTETEDDGHPVENPWNAYQVKELIREGVWLHRTYGIPVEVPKTWDAPGMGYHSLFPMVWTNVPGKTCPGSTRIHQFLNVVLPGIRAALTGDDLDMDKAELQQAVREVLNEGAGTGQQNWAGTSKATLSGVQGNTNRLNAITAAIEALPAEVVAALPPASSGGITQAQVEAACTAAIDKTLGFLKPGQ